jgi:hypothetical protein
LTVAEIVWVARAKIEVKPTQQHTFHTTDTIYNNRMRAKRENLDAQRNKVSRERAQEQRAKGKKMESLIERHQNRTVDNFIRRFQPTVSRVAGVSRKSKKKSSLANKEPERNYTAASDTYLRQQYGQKSTFRFRRCGTVCSNLKQNQFREEQDLKIQ